MGNRKPASHVDRLPTDYEQPRRNTDPSGGGDFGSSLVLTPLTEQEAADRAERAMAVLRSYGAEDVAPMLGLAEPPESPRNVGRPVSVPCPQCGMPAGKRCVAISSGDDMGGSSHRGRQRRAVEAKEPTT